VGHACVPARRSVYDNNAGLIFRTMTRLLNATIPFSTPSSKAGDTAAIAEANRKFVRVRRRRVVATARRVEAARLNRAFARVLRRAPA